VGSFVLSFEISSICAVSCSVLLFNAESYINTVGVFIFSFRFFSSQAISSYSFSRPLYSFLVKKTFRSSSTFVPNLMLFVFGFQSKLCHLRDADPHKLVFHGEEATEMGG
jgi:hypothetical protein